MFISIFAGFDSILGIWMLGFWVEVSKWPSISKFFIWIFEFDSSLFPFSTEIFDLCISLVCDAKLTSISTGFKFEFMFICTLSCVVLTCLCKLFVGFCSIVNDFSKLPDTVLLLSTLFSIKEKSISTDWGSSLILVSSPRSVDDFIFPSIDGMLDFKSRFLVLKFTLDSGNLSWSKDELKSNDFDFNSFFCIL